MRKDFGVLLACVVVATGMVGCGEPRGAVNLSNSAVPVAEQMLDIVVRLRPEIAPLFHRGGDRVAAEATELTAVLRQFGVDLTPQHPDVPDPELRSYFTIPGIPTQAEAERIAAGLRKLDAVEAAYIQPPASPA